MVLSRIRRLHVGQVCLLVAGAAVLAALALVERRSVAARDAVTSYLEAQAQSSLDEVQDSLRHASSTLSDNPFMHLSDTDKYAARVRLSTQASLLDSVRTQRAREYVGAEVELYALDIAFGAIVACTFALLWVWFGSRNQGAAQ